MLICYCVTVSLKKVTLSEICYYVIVSFKKGYSVRNMLLCL